MKNIVLLIVVLLICAGVIYTQQTKETEPIALDDAPAVQNAEPVALEDEQSGAETVTEADSSQADQTPEANSLISEAAADAQVFFVRPQNGDVVSSPVTIEFGLENMAVSPAGIDVPFSGHHHLLINMAELPDLTAPLPATDSLIHFGGGQTQTSIELEPGTHTLQLLLGNHLHIPHDTPVISEKITITVE